MCTMHSLPPEPVATVGCEVTVSDAGPNFDEARRHRARPRDRSRAGRPGGQSLAVEPPSLEAHRPARGVIARPAQPERRLIAAAVSRHMQNAGRRPARQKHALVHTFELGRSRTTRRGEIGHPAAHTVQDSRPPRRSPASPNA